MFDSLPDHFSLVKFSGACTVNDLTTDITTKCSPGDGFKAKYMRGIVAGDTETIGSLMSLVLDTYTF
jgi:hypothetical protein